MLACVITWAGRAVPAQPGYQSKPKIGFAHLVPRLSQSCWTHVKTRHKPAAPRRLEQLATYFPLSVSREFIFLNKFTLCLYYLLGVLINLERIMWQFINETTKKQGFKHTVKWSNFPHGRPLRLYYADAQ